ncbi:MAG: hypothetical protein ACK53T_06645 [Planctomycetota bacterium]
MTAAAGGEFVPLVQVAAELHTTPAQLRRRSLAGDFPPLLRVSAKHYLLRRVDLQAWQAGRWTTEAAARAAIVAEAVRGEVVNRRAVRRGSTLPAPLGSTSMAP